MTLAVSTVVPGVERWHMSSWQGRAVGYEVSAYLIDDVLVDCGFPRVAGEFTAAMERARPRGVVVTHWHEDHSGNAEALASLGVPLVMHRECERLLREAPEIRAYRRIVWSSAPRLVSPLIAFDALPLQVLHMPGHTNGHMVVYDAERGIVVSGDLFLGVKVRVAHEHERPLLLAQSLRRVAALRPAWLLDAHRGPVANPAPLLEAKAAWLEQTAGEVMALHARGLHERAIASRVFGREPFVGFVSRGEYSKVGLVRAVLHEPVVPASP